MKKFFNIKLAILPLIILVTVLFTVSCDNKAEVDDTKSLAEDRNDAKFDDRKLENDAQFLVNASEINLEGIQLGLLAQQNGNSDGVKALGKQMEEAHAKLQRELVILAQSKNISIPTAPTDAAQEAYASLVKKTGSDFDKSYADKMVSAHKDAIGSFEDATTDCKDPEIKKWAIATLPELRTHLNHAIESQKQNGKS